MSAVLKKSTPGKFAYTCHFQQIGINATKIEKTGIHFKTDVFAAVAVVDAKAPFWLGGSGVGDFARRNYTVPQRLGVVNGIQKYSHRMKKKNV